MMKNPPYPPFVKGGKLKPSKRGSQGISAFEVPLWKRGILVDFERVFHGNACGCKKIA
jgi:hypothetical protein